VVVIVSSAYNNLLEDPSLSAKLFEIKKGLLLILRDQIFVVGFIARIFFNSQQLC